MATVQDIQAMARRNAQIIKQTVNKQKEPAINGRLRVAGNVRQGTVLCLLLLSLC